MFQSVLNCSFPFSHNLSYRTYDTVVFVFGVVFIFHIFLRRQVWLNKKLTKVLVISGLLLTAGLVGNVFQREFVTPGCVADYIPFLGLFHFNLFDLAISIGIVGLLYELYEGNL